MVGAKIAREGIIKQYISAMPFEMENGFSKDVFDEIVNTLNLLLLNGCLDAAIPYYLEEEQEMGGIWRCIACICDCHDFWFEMKRKAAIIEKTYHDHFKAEISRFELIVSNTNPNFRFRVPEFNFMSSFNQTRHKNRAAMYNSYGHWVSYPNFLEFYSNVPWSQQNSKGLLLPLSSQSSPVMPQYGTIINVQPIPEYGSGTQEYQAHPAPEYGPSGATMGTLTLLSQVLYPPPPLLPGTLTPLS